MLMFAPETICVDVVRSVLNVKVDKKMVPVLLLRARLAEDSDVLRAQELKPDLEVGITVGAGHFHQLEVPEQVNAMIERFLQLDA